jgi:hypothetical protein
MGVLPAIILSNGGPGGANIPPPSHAKNIVNMSGENLDPQDYYAFGTMVDCGAYLLQILRIAQGHLGPAGKYYKRKIPKDTLTPGPWSLLYEWTHNLEDCYAHIVDGNKICLQFSSSDNNIGGAGWDMRKCAYFMLDLDGNIISGPHDTLVPGSAPTTRFWPFGRGGYLGAAGCYGQALLGLTLAPPDYNSISAGRVWFLRTTDSWATFQIIEVYNGTDSDETLFIPLVDGSGSRGVMIKRRSGRAMMYRCANVLATTPVWTAFGEINLGDFFMNAKVTTYDIHSGLVDIAYADRDTGMISISYDNTFSNLYNGIVNKGQVFDRGTVPLPYEGYDPLGYPAYISNVGPSSYGGVLSFLGYSKEVVHDNSGEAGGKAEFWGTFFDRNHDETGPPAAPPALTLVAPTLTANAFKVEITGYTQAQIQNIKQWVWDISTDAGFAPGTFATLSIEWVQPAVLVKDIVMPSMRIWPQTATANTTYYIRAKAVNNSGQSIYTTISVTTTA